MTKDKEVKVIKVDLLNEIQHRFNGVTPKERQKIAYEYIMKSLRKEYKMTDSRVVFINKRSADKLSNTLDELKIRIIPELGKAIEKAELINIKDVEHKVFDKFAYYLVYFKIGNIIKKAELNVGINTINKTAVLYFVKFIDN
jgi:hypothetical protein